MNSNCYLICLGDYAGYGPHGVEVFNTLLRLQEVNPDRVYLLAGDHEDQLKAQSDEFQKEFFEKFCTLSQDEDVKKVWQKLVNLCVQLPRVLLLGLQMPSTHNYDFLLFCHGCFEHGWRPQDFMRSIVKNHIDNEYKSPQSIPYQTDSLGKKAFVTGEFTDENSSTKRASDNTWTKTAFEEFVQRHGSCVDPKYMYHCCLRAILRGHDHITGGLVRLKNTGLKMWRRLKDSKSYEIEPCSVFTCIQGLKG